MKRMRRSERIEREAMERFYDRLNDLPDCVKIHIMNFMNAKDAVQTCVLSKRWKDLWKRLTTLTFESLDFHMLPFFTKFVSSVLSRRDDSFKLHTLNLWHERIGPRLLNRVMTYAASHHVQQLLISVTLNNNQVFELPSSLFHCGSLTSLNLSFGYYPFSTMKLPKSLELPTLKILNALLSHGSIRTQLPSFVRLKSLKLHSDIPDEEVSRMVEYLLHNSPLTRVDIIKVKVVPRFII